MSDFNIAQGRRVLRITCLPSASMNELLKKYNSQVIDQGWAIDDMDSGEVLEFMKTIIEDPLAVNMDGQRLRLKDFEIDGI